MKNILSFLALAAVLLSGCSDDKTTTAPSSSTDPSSTPVPAIQYDALFVVNGGDHSISVINTQTNEPTGTIQLKNISYPHHISMNAAHSMLSLSVPGMDMSGGHSGGMSGMKGMVLMLDATTGSMMSFKQLDAMNHNAPYSPDNKEIWTCRMMSDGAVLVLDAATLDLKRTITVGSQPAEITFSKDGRYAFVCNGGSGSVTVIDVSTKAVVKTIPVGEDPVGAWPGTNGVMYVDNEHSKTLTAIDAQTLEVLYTYQLGFTPAMAFIAPDGNLWVTDTDNGKVVFYKPTEDMKLGELTTGAGAHAIAFSGDGSTAYVSNQMAGTVSVIDIATKNVLKNIPVGSKPNGMVWRAK